DDTTLVHRAIQKAKKVEDKPTLIEVKTIIGKGTSIQGTHKVHGAAIGEAEAYNLRNYLDYHYAPFEVAPEVYELYQTKVYNRGKRQFNKWKKMFKAYKINYPELAREFKNFVEGKLNVDFSSLKFEAGTKDATRNMLGKGLDLLSKQNLNILGGSADLTSSTQAKGLDGHYSKTHRLGRNFNFGVREHAMGSIVNGINLHGGLKAFSGAFFVFS